MRQGGGNRSRLLLISLIVTSLFLITLDLRGVSVLDGARTGTQNVLGPFQRAGNVVLSPVKNFFSDITHLGRTRTQLENLRIENSKLRRELIIRRNADGQLSQLKSILDLAGTAEYKVVNCRTISQGSGQSFSETITIDCGSNARIRTNMTVISQDGIVGVVKEVSANTSVVMLATDPTFRIGVRVAGTQQIGILSGRGSSTSTLQLLDNLTTIKVGDVLLARGSISNRPFVPGVPVGYVTDIDNSAGEIAQSGAVHYYANFNNLGVVAVVVGAPVTNPGDALVPAKPTPKPTPTVTIYVTPSPTPTN